MREYYNDGVKEDDSYIFYKDIGRGYKYRVELICHEINNWGYRKYANKVRHQYDEWTIVDSFGLLVNSEVL